MSEPVDLHTAAAPHDVQESAAQAGMLLRQMREAHGLHVAAMAFSLKVPVNKLEALEAGRIDLLPDVVFARGLAASVCRNLKVDPTQVLELLPRHGASRLGSDGPVVNTPFRPPGAGPNFSVPSRLASPAMLAVLVLLVGALSLLLWPKARDAADAVVTAPVANTPAPMVVEPASAPAPAAEPLAAASSPLAVPAGSAASAASSVSADGGIFVVTAKGESWVQVTDANGAMPLNRVVKPGETVQVAGQVPLKVVVGRADAVEIQVRGQPLNLAPMTKVNVARFEVK
jgi:cytoskeleton protein RodZ